MSWYGVIAAACCCEPEGPCFGCGVTAWTASGFGGGTLTWEAECNEYYIEEFDLWVSDGLVGSYSYTVPSSITLEFVSENELCCLWEGSTAWVDGGQIDTCPDWGGETESYPHEYRFRTEAQLSICELSAGSGMFKARLVVVVIGEKRTQLTGWARFGGFTHPYESPTPGACVAWCSWEAPINPALWCPEGGDLTDGDGLAPEIVGGDPGTIILTSTLDWGVEGPPADVTIS